MWEPVPFALKLTRAALKSSNILRDFFLDGMYGFVVWEGGCWTQLTGVVRVLQSEKEMLSAFLLRRSSSLCNCDTACDKSDVLSLMSFRLERMTDAKILSVIIEHTRTTADG